jgi:uncharacterized protein (TIGR03032 family)
MSDQVAFRILTSPGFADWLESVQTSLAFSTYQMGKLFFVGRKENQTISIFERTFNRCLGLWSNTQSLWLASAFQLWRLENVLAPGQLTDDGYDALYVPQQAHTTGDVDVHDLCVEASGRVVFVNTLFSCLSTLSERYSFQPLWQPPFVDRLAAEDRCHLNGLAAEAGRAKYVTACSQSNERQAWREHRIDGGCVVDVESGETIVERLSMPHSPRVYRDQLWLLNSGIGDFGRVDVRRGTFESVAFCPGYARGLAFIDHFAIIGLSRPRNETFSGLPLDEQLTRRRVTPGCGLLVLDLNRGVPVEWLQIEGRVDELYDVVVLPGLRRPHALGLKNDQIRRNVWFEDQDRVVRWTAGEGEGLEG